ncbi:MAG: hypothetical protein D6715_02610 [Calditrichaeota bacterium]|nr:MAG: hypothetical protein D6715_02610 [Calditrichota bacterium]
MPVSAKRKPWCGMGRGGIHQKDTRDGMDGVFCLFGQPGHFCLDGPGLALWSQKRKQTGGIATQETGS